MSFFVLAEGQRGIAVSLSIPVPEILQWIPAATIPFPAELLPKDDATVFERLLALKQCSEFDNTALLHQKAVHLAWAVPKPFSERFAIACQLARWYEWHHNRCRMSSLAARTPNPIVLPVALATHPKRQALALQRFLLLAALGIPTPCRPVPGCLFQREQAPDSPLQQVYLPDR